MASRLPVLEISTEGNGAIARFCAVDFPNEIVLEQCRRELDEFLAAHPCDVLTFDLDGIVIIPSTMLGLLLALRQRGLRIRIVNPSEHVRAVLTITRLASKLEIEPITPA